MVAGLTMAAGGVVLAAAPARASCPSGNYATLGVDRDVLNGPKPNVRGLDGRVYVNEVSGQCGIVRSLIVADPQSVWSDFVEVGWDQGSYYSHPRNQAFIWWKIAGTGDGLVGLGTSTTDAFHSFSIKDPDANNNWTAWLDGTSLGHTPNVAFTRGVPFDNSERHENPGDTGWGHFKALSKCEALNCGTWPNFDNLRCYEDAPFPDPGYYFDRVDNTENYMRQGSGC